MLGDLILRRWRAVVLAIGVLALIGCASTVQEWVKPGAAHISRLAVLPFENQTSALRAGQAVSDLLVSEILATGTTPDLIRLSVNSFSYQRSDQSLIHGLMSQITPLMMMVSVMAKPRLTLSV